MAPTNRRAAALDVVVVHGSDSEPDSDAEKSPHRKHTSKRQKTGTGTWISIIIWRLSTRSDVWIVF